MNNMQKNKKILSFFIIFLLLSSISFELINFSQAVDGGSGGTQQKYVYGNGNYTSTGWVTPNNAWDNNTALGASVTWATAAYCNYYTLNLTSSVRGNLVQYFVNRTASTVTTMQIDTANQTGSWTNRFSATPTYGSYANATLSATDTYTALRFRATSTGTTSRIFSLNETQAVNDKVNVVETENVTQVVRLADSSSRKDDVKRPIILVPTILSGLTKSFSGIRSASQLISPTLTLNKTTNHTITSNLFEKLTTSISRLLTDKRSSTQIISDTTTTSRTVGNIVTNGILIQISSSLSRIIGLHQTSILTPTLVLSVSRIESISRSNSLLSQLIDEITKTLGFGRTNSLSTPQLNSASRIEGLTRNNDQTILSSQSQTRIVGKIISSDLLTQLTLFFSKSFGGYRTSEQTITSSILTTRIDGAIRTNTLLSAIGVDVSRTFMGSRTVDLTDKPLTSASRISHHSVTIYSAILHTISVSRIANDIRNSFLSLPFSETVSPLKFIIYVNSTQDNSGLVTNFPTVILDVITNTTNILNFFWVNPTVNVEITNKGNYAGDVKFSYNLLDAKNESVTYGIQTIFMNSSSTKNIAIQLPHLKDGTYTLQVNSISPMVASSSAQIIVTTPNYIYFIILLCVIAILCAIFFGGKKKK